MKNAMQKTAFHGPKAPAMTAVPAYRIVEALEALNQLDCFVIIEACQKRIAVLSGNTGKVVGINRSAILGPPDATQQRVMAAFVTQPDPEKEALAQLAKLLRGH